MWGYSNGYLALLKEEDNEYKVYAIEQLLNVVDLEWAQIADNLPIIEQLANAQDFAARKQAALLASRTYYRLGNFEKAVSLAIKSEDLFDSSSNEDFSLVIKSNLITMCRAWARSGKEIDQATLNILSRILDDMISKQDIAACYCIAVETRQDLFITKCVETLPEILPYALKVATKIQDPEYRSKILRVLVGYASDRCPETQLARIYRSLEDPDSVSALLITLATSDDPNHVLLGYQIAFDLAEDASQKFRAPIISILAEDLPIYKDILTRQIPLKLQLYLLYKKTVDDQALLKAIKEGFDTENFQSVHSAAVIPFAYMYANTGDDAYYRENREWFGKCEKWHKFLTIAAVGSVHMGNLDAALNVLSGYLSSRSESEVTGGALFALGLIYANYAWDEKVNDVVRQSLRNSRQMYVRFGASLALGLINIGSQNVSDYEVLKDIIYAEPPVPETGEGAGYAIGMVMLGSGYSEELEELLSFAERCEHDKINRGLAMAFALFMYGQEQNADRLIDRLAEERQPVLRESAAWTLALAYVGTGNNDAVQRLLHIAVSDTSNDVRRIAVIGVGFVMSRNPEKVPEMLGLLSLSYHPYVRSGAALAIGIALAGTGNTEAIELVKPLLKDSDPVVLQSAIISMAMLLQQQSDAAVPYCKEFRQFLRKKISMRAMEMTSFSVGTAYGLLYATGRNAIVSCNTLRGENSIVSTVGIALFCNYFYFLPLALMLPLGFHPTTMIGLNEQLETVEWAVLSRAKPSLFANPPPFESEKEVKKIADAVKLSISKHVKPKQEKEAAKEEQKQANEAEAAKSNETSNETSSEQQTAETAQTAEESEQKPEGAAEENKEEKNVLQDMMPVEPQEEIIINPARVTLSQLKYIDTTYSGDYEPIISEPSLGFIMLRPKANNNNEEEKKEE